KPRSLKTYGHRFRRALVSYLEYLENPADWKYGTTEAKPTGEGTKPKQRPRIKTSRGFRPEEERDDDFDGLTIIEYPYPLRPGMVIKFKLPADLTKREASRLGEYLQTLALDPQLAITAGGD